MFLLWRRKRKNIPGDECYGISIVCAFVLRAWTQARVKADAGTSPTVLGRFTICRASTICGDVRLAHPQRARGKRPSASRHNDAILDSSGIQEPRDIVAGTHLNDLEILEK